MLSTALGDIPYNPEPGENIVGQYKTYSIAHRRQPTGETGVMILTTQRIVFYRHEAVIGNPHRLSFATYYTQIVKFRHATVAGYKFIEVNGIRFYMEEKELKAAIKLIKLGKRGKIKRMEKRTTTKGSLHPPTLQQRTPIPQQQRLQQPQQPQQPQQRAVQPQPTKVMDPIYAKGLERVADEIVQQVVQKPATPPAVAPGSQVSQPVTTIAASRSMVMKPVVKNAEAITSAEAVAAKRAMLERVLAPQSREAQALASQVMGSIASTKAVKGLKKGAAGAAHAEGKSAAPIDNTENEVTAIKEKKVCVVHKGPISGAIFLCPKCETFYCYKCATFLKKNGEKCWSCQAEMDVPDLDT